MIAFFLFMTGGCSAASEDSQESSPPVTLPAPAALESYALPDWTSAPPPDPIPTSSRTTERTEETTEEAAVDKTARIAFAGDTTQSDVFGEVTDAHGIALLRTSRRSFG
ncbi:MAG: hypothetical protein K2N29_07090, partial [Ruminiclostridium sp.]|nr:hypothetical protein [Ruminiclostridium sp.]